MQLKEKFNYFCKEYKIIPNLELDQFFMIDPFTIEEMVELAKVNKKDVVLEIGSGFGFLTEVLAKKAKKVITIEIDKRFERILKKEFKKFKNVQIIIGNALNYISKLKFNKIVSNPPYCICEPLIHKLFKIKFDCAVMTLPLNFTKILTAKPKEKEYNILSLLTSSFFNIEIRESPVDRDVFYPTATVDSVIIKITPKLINVEIESDKFIIKDLYLQQKKKVKNALRETLINLYKEVGKNLTKRESKKIIEKLKLSNELLEKKVNSLSLKDYEKIIKNFKLF